jgi:hypothetical protein
VEERSETNADRDDLNFDRSRILQSNQAPHRTQPYGRLDGTLTSAHKRREANKKGVRPYCTLETTMMSGD